jgi:hypothetical protein
MFSFFSLPSSIMIIYDLEAIIFQYNKPCLYVCLADPGGRAVKGRFVAGIAGSNPAESMDVCLLCLYVVLSCAEVCAMG